MASPLPLSELGEIVAVTRARPYIPRTVALAAVLPRTRYSDLWLSYGFLVSGVPFFVTSLLALQGVAHFVIVQCPVNPQITPAVRPTRHTNTPIVVTWWSCATATLLVSLVPAWNSQLDRQRYPGLACGISFFGTA
jgi:hypothetical protein